MPKRYFQVTPETGWFTPQRKDYHLACCDCGLVHRVDHRIKDGHIQWRFHFAKRSTAAVRRGKHSFTKTIK